ncbi:MAG: GHKL domain-containing protein [Defluviitaleaceae bacterium]|nr:GHKL domain-containing protein [Defluviitaleaceae bacterium]
MGILSWVLSTLIDKRMADFQNDIMRTYIAEVEYIYSEMRGWRHDYHNHMQTLLAHLHMAQYNEMEHYIVGLAADLAQVDTIIKTENVMADAILNSKISVARARDIKVYVKAFVPKELTISEIDLCIIIGNLLDNAVEACAKIKDIENRFIRVYVDVLKNQLYISVFNAMEGRIKKRGISFKSTKGKQGHGFGLVRIDKIVDKYNGYVNRKHEEGVFATEVMLPI